MGILRTATTRASAPRHRFVLALAGLALACTTPPTVEHDAGSDAADGGDPLPDAFYLTADSGPPGAALLPLDACDDAVEGLYATPPGLPPFEPSVRGTVLGCATVETIPAADVRTRLAGVPGLTFSGGDVRVYVIAYRTEREPRGLGGISTALVYLPEIALSERVPLVLVAHGTVGLADACAPSRFVRDGTDVGLPAAYTDALLLSFVARGMPVVVPDYAGLGTEGTHGYGNWLDPTRSAVDGVRALRTLLPSARLDGGTLVYGHSQGGGIALAAAALEAEAPDVDIRAVVAAAPAYRVAALPTILRLESFALTPVLRATAGLVVYADYANLTADETRWAEAFAPALRGRFDEELGSHCFVEAGTALDTPTAGYTPPATVGELFDPDFRAAALACADGGSCDGLPGAWVQRDEANEPHLSADSPPLLVLGSTVDEIATPGAVGCALDRLRREDAAHETCMVSEGDHLGMVAGTAALAIEWALAASTDARRPPCPGSTDDPRCSLL